LSASSVPAQRNIATTPSASTTAPVAAPSEVNIAITTTLADIFKQFGDEAADTALLKQQRAAAEKEVKKKRDEYNKGKTNHAKFPASEESQRKARDHAARQLEAINKRLEEKDSSLKDIATSAALRIPNVLGASSVGNSAEGQQKMRQDCDNLTKRCNDLQQQLEDQKKQMDDERKAREQLEQKHSTLVSQYTSTQSKFGEAKALQSKFEGDIRSELKKEADDSQKEIQDLKRSATSALSVLSRIPPDLQQTLQRFDDFFKRLNGLPNVEAELHKIRGELAENSKNLEGQITPLIEGLEQAKGDVATHAKHITDTAKEQAAFQEKLKDWKKGIDATVSAVGKLSKQEYASKQDLNTLKQEVVRISSKPATPPADLPLNPAILVPLQDLQARVQTLDKQLGALNFSRVETRVQRVENRLSTCEENNKTYVGASKFSEALDEVTDMKQAINTMNEKWASLNEKVDKQRKEVPTRSPIPDNRAATPVSGSRITSASLPANTTTDSELKQRVAFIEARLPPFRSPTEKFATREWVAKEIEASHEVNDDFVGKELDKVKIKAATNERNIDDIVENVQRMSDQINTLQPSQTTSPTGENPTVVENAVAKSFSSFEQKHMNNLAIVQQNTQNLHDQLFKPDGVFNRLEGLGVAFTNLDTRVSKINTLDLHQSMVHQFNQEHFPQLQILPNLESQAQATAERVSALEKVATHLPLSEIRDIQEATQTLSDKVNSLESRTSNHNTRITTLEARAGKDTDSHFQKEMRTEMDRNTHDLSKLNSKMKNDFQSIVPKVVQLESEIELVKSDIKEIRGETEENKKGMEQFQNVVARKFADQTIDIRGIRDQLNPSKSATSTTRSAPSTSPFNNNPNNSIRDRKTSTPVTNGTLKRKLENGHSAHSSLSSTSRMNGASRGSSIDHSKKSKRRRRNPEEDEDDDDYEDVRQPTVMYSDSEEED